MKTFFTLFLAIIVGLLIAHIVATAIERQNEIDDAKTAKHVGQMSEDVRQVIGGQKTKN